MCTVSQKRVNMVQGKSVTFQDSGEFKFKEPDGMTEIDLRRLSELSALSDGSITGIKNYKCRIIKYVLLVPIILILLLCLVISANNLFTPQPKSALIDYYISKISLCKAAKTLETCCSILVETDNDFSLKDCTLDNLQRFLDREKKVPASFLNQDISDSEAFESFKKDIDYLNNDFNPELDFNTNYQDTNLFINKLDEAAQNILESFKKDTSDLLDGVSDIKNSIYKNILSRQNERDVLSSIGTVEQPQIEDKDLQLAFDNTSINITYNKDNKIKRHIEDPYEYYDTPDYLSQHPHFEQYGMDNPIDHMNSQYHQHVSDDEVSYHRDISLPEHNFYPNNFNEVVHNLDEIHLMNTPILDENNHQYYDHQNQQIGAPYIDTNTNLQGQFQRNGEINPNEERFIQRDSNLSPLDNPFIKEIEMSKSNDFKTPFSVPQLRENPGFSMELPNNNFVPHLTQRQDPQEKEISYYNQNPQLTQNFDNPIFRNIHNEHESKHEPNEKNAEELINRQDQTHNVGLSQNVDTIDPNKLFPSNTNLFNKGINNDELLENSFLELSNQSFQNVDLQTRNNFGSDLNLEEIKNDNNQSIGTVDLESADEINNDDNLILRKINNDLILEKINNEQDQISERNYNYDNTEEEINANEDTKSKERQNVIIGRVKSENDNQQSKVELTNLQTRQGMACYTPSLPYAPAPLPYQYDPNLRFAQILPVMPQMQPYSYVSQNYPKIEQQYPYGNQQYPYGNQQYQQNLYPIQVANSAGQYYICNPVASQTNQIAGLPGVEVRLSNSPKLIVGAPLNLKNRARDSNDCGFGHVRCSDDSKCVREEHICDGKVHCADASDEKDCSCAYRIGEHRMCDKYYDCPHGEDEKNCAGCGPHAFNCGDWSYGFNKRATCIPLDKRCDGIPHCSNERDEQGCSILLETLESNNEIIKVGYTTGFLHRNFKGMWYPACSNSEVWASEACRDESGPSTFAPLTNMVAIDFSYKDSFVNSGSQIEVVTSCVEGRAVYVECPPPVCGMRKMETNLYRSDEIDTSAEDVISRFRNRRNVSDPILGNGRVVGGKACQPGAWPWVVSIYRNGNFHCGGVLINDEWIVTAAHCMEKYWKYYFEVEVGMLRRFSYSPMQQSRYVSNVISHEDYNRASLKNDLALMKLNKAVKFNRYVKPICLPTEFTAGQNYNKGPSPGTICTAIGWGATVEHGADPDNLRQVEVPILPICKHKEDEAGGDICAGLMEGGKDACQGDSGGPFICRNPNRPDQWYLAGIVSHGEGCARPNEPGVYTRVPMYRGWIYEHAKNEALPHKKPLDQCPGYVCNVINKCIPRKSVCDKIVDCLNGDDEFNCEQRSTFASLFKNAMHHILPHDSQVFKFRNNNSTSQENNTEPRTVTTIPEENVTTITPNNVNDNFKNVSNDKNITFHSIKGGRFLCKRLLAVIPLNKKCDKNIDCEDGTDERSCKCSEYLKNSNPELICDGFYDCADFSDEQNCGLSCSQNQFQCLESKKCISSSQRCDGHVDCIFEEDEHDCIVLIDTKTVELDSEDRPKLQSRGLIAYNWRNQWLPFCGNFSDKESQISSEVCNALGFTDYSYYKEIQIIDKPFNNINNDTIYNKTCNGLYIKCNNYNVFTHVINHNIAQIKKKTKDFAPWNSLIFVDGKYKCSGVLLNQNWILTSIHCFINMTNFQNHYITALFGIGFKQDFDINGPHEEVISVDNYKIEGSDFLLLHLKQNVSTTRYIRPIYFQERNHLVLQKETCIAMGADFNHTLQAVPLQPVQNCTDGFRCFMRLDELPTECKVSNDINPWSGCVVCDSGSGIYPAAIFSHPKGHCGFNEALNFTNVAKYKNKIFKNIGQTAITLIPEMCEGFRCNLGNCIGKSKVCNGVPDCRGGDDENPDYCAKMKEYCHLSGDCVCAPDELRCDNGNCVSKEAFCNLKDDCGDNSDEPARCNCYEYLRLANSSKICDGTRHCLDRSDEDPKKCNCGSNKFKCKTSSLCISNDMVCDGYPDCPDGEDESRCFSLLPLKNSNKMGEVISLTGGVWHSGCFPQNLLTTELEELCKEIGFSGSSASYLKKTDDVAQRPTIDFFTFTWIRKSSRNKLKIGMRSGDHPFVHFVDDPDCYKLYIECL